MPSIFSKIILREIPAHIVYEDDQVIAFLDISQATKGHTLVVPKVEYKDIFEVPEKTSSRVFEVATKLAKAIQKAFGAHAMNILSNNGEYAGQTVFHFHIHLIPRYDKADENLFKLKNNQGNLTPDEYKERARLIKEALS
ncbi:MAG: diadenosine tetraphosphate hydrolase [Tenericutes bacterium GWC2_34_14]|nr:MAG: diadenosine tetraphosphate hydrolase [Tenericutes bacterium GWA2_35_7]OHE28061.1 MAG: diadenosine tetraphosphate hydrolase [Tenericutes bacterium GWC2_34_14]OHE32998.1 MAG: diadenosine tetraphosphate hydrolase [Tenericutes bacterium GWE2_34_108]OHE36036.1 MAG: diadenosine tetraphosphate hydrolase [Tenericutes bacterium GWF1_35_14]OHE39259.1 MAG: diadenosine tetraphosphate hydrolase [Tenericutes bacterium GWF2_35_184]OHE44534.1 MAG: diadenosine tetraphosphate hydrolase [Tenericutes bact